MNVYLAYQKYNRDFIAYAKSITRNSDRAFDLVQEAYISALEREEIFCNMNEYQIKGWFFTTIKNKNIDAIRKQSRLTYLENDGLLGKSDGFEENVIMAELIDKLPEKNRKILILRYEMNLNSVEIGHMLGISDSTVRSRLSASLKLLRKKI
ncbi:sigma-70 family RNA polymerase sigma factor [Clostridium sp. D2Q-14]|uniref:RNA polymerase sigma factor n=1 Tax=Anaeromonas gelatinilytica TaxID=2683194 RepID=UPI00193B4BE6|nr:sigma-70 family RNA polymerase sigma factor [Anaeromonas gelatinilytica]MBS4536508.1 sigma-70 family RNA polymerase sigma factor [Anaeromonas gelatinilytica]